jgi:hypothetical protein
VERCSVDAVRFGEGHGLGERLDGARDEEVAAQFHDVGRPRVVAKVKAALGRRRAGQDFARRVARRAVCARDGKRRLA